MRQRFAFKLAAPALVVSLVLLALGATAAWYVHRQQQEAAAMLSTNITKLTAADELLASSHELRHELSLFLATQDPVHLHGAVRVHRLTDDLLARCEQLAESDDEIRLTREMKRRYAQVYDDFSVLERPGPAQTRREAALRLTRGLSTKRILAPVLEYRNLLGEQRIAAQRRDQSLADSMAIGLLVLGSCGCVAGLIAGFGFARAVQRSIVELSIPMFDTAGKLKEVVGPVELSGDETEDMNAAMRSIATRVENVIENLRKSQEAAHRSERLASLGQLAAGVAHELRNPLTSIKLIVQTASEQPGGVDATDRVVLEQEIARMESRIQTFLDYARPPRLNKGPVNLSRELTDSVRFVAVQADRHGVRIETEIPLDDNLVEADASQLRQVFLNLLINALDAAGEDGRIEVRLIYDRDPDEEEAVSARISVCDDGPGLSESNRDSIFEPFMTTKEAGTGLGLPICKRIVEDHGGTIAAFDSPTGGACFTVVLPLSLCRNANPLSV